MLELRDPQHQVVRLLALHEPQLGDQPVDQLVAPEPGAFGLTPPAGEGRANRPPQVVTVEPDEARQVVGEVVGRLCRQ